MQQDDPLTRRQLDTLIGNLYSGARLQWDADGNLRVTSVNTPGAVYRVTERSCDCLARGLCWHRRVYELLLDLFATDVVTADMAAAH